MGGDFSRDSFDPAQHFARVLTQQGRVQLDADANEQVSILLHYLRTLAADLIGPYGGPVDAQDYGFKIMAVLDKNDATKIADLAIGSGRYYVGGILIENEALRTPAARQQAGDQVRLRGRGGRFARAEGSAPATESGSSYFSQPDLYPDPQRERLPDSGAFLVYLDVWERVISAAEDPSIRDPALGANGPDSAARAKVVWQVRTSSQLPPDIILDGRTDEQIQTDVRAAWAAWVDAQRPPHRGLLQAKGRDDLPDETDVCIVDPKSRYRGEENQLYRVEIHSSGAAGTASFKWSRDNGSVVFPIATLEGATVALESLGRDVATTLSIEDWVEIVDDDAALRGYDANTPPPALAQIDTIEPIDHVLTLTGTPGTTAGHDPRLHPLLRRWDQRAGDTQLGIPEINADGTLKLSEGRWLTLEDGVQIFFQAGSDGMPQQYRPGDYWLIPARVATGDVIWPQELTPASSAGDAEQDARPKALPPHGVDHQYAPLALVRSATQLVDLRSSFPPLVALAAKGRDT